MASAFCVMLGDLEACMALLLRRPLHRSKNKRVVCHGLLGVHAFGGNVCGLGAYMVRGRMSMLLQ